MRKLATLVELDDGDLVDLEIRQKLQSLTEDLVGDPDVHFINALIDEDKLANASRDNQKNVILLMNDDMLPDQIPALDVLERGDEYPDAKRFVKK